ncbi:MAG TPA: hypothetical protein VK624_11675 [Steroidobacteraceae bacterium]|nr:hypothetical protein [Steroidobacteraceae bacterium]
MKAVTSIAVAAIAIALCAVWWVGRNADSQLPSPAVQTVRPAKPEAPASPAPTPSSHPADPPQTKDASARTTSRPDLRAQMEASNDYWAFAESIYDAAKQGDRDAQYFLYQALLYCSAFYNPLFVVQEPIRDRTHRSLDEALQRSAGFSPRMFSDDEVRQVQMRCERLESAKEPPFGQFEQWSKAALASEQPLALVEEASRRAYRHPTQPDSESARVKRAEARRLALQALGTKDPEVMALTAEVSANLAGSFSQAGDTRRLVWQLVACGHDEACPVLASKTFFCRAEPECTYETPRDTIRRRAGNDFDEVDRMAHELLKKIEARTLEESDL